MEELKGYVDHIIFRNPDNGYTVFVMVCDEELTCVGTFSMLSEGENIMVKGEYHRASDVWKAVYGSDIRRM